MPPWLATRWRPWLLGIGAFVALSWAGWRAPRTLLVPEPSLAGATPDSLADLPGSSPRQRHLHLAQLGVDRWHQAGYRGQGVTIAVLDSGFRGWGDFLGKGLPRHLKTRSFRKDGNLEARDSQHGILCAEAIHTLAPAAQLLLANWEPDAPESFLDAVRWARSQGANILSCSVIMPNWSDGEGGGHVHAGLQRLLDRQDFARDVLFFASAGNIAQRHWSGRFRPDARGLHQWIPGQTLNPVKPWGKDRVSIQAYGPLQIACEVQVLDHKTGTLVGKAPLQLEANQSAPWSQAVVRFDPLPGRGYVVKLQMLGNVLTKDHTKDPPEKLHVVALGGSLEHVTLGGSIPFPGDGLGVLAVGAVDETGKRLSYSSCGPNSKKPKPDLVATVPFPCSCRERPFAGTSAAAPQAAGLAALCWSRHTDWPAHKIAQALQAAALDLATPGHDWETGHGLIRLP